MYKLKIKASNIFGRSFEYNAFFNSYWSARNYMFNFEGDFSELAIFDESGKEGESVRRRGFNG